MASELQTHNKGPGNEDTTRININVVVDGQLGGYARIQNAKIVQAGHTDIDFVSRSLHIPHLTLLMGTVANGDRIEAILSRVVEAAQMTKPFAVEITEPYLSPDD